MYEVERVLEQHNVVGEGPIWSPLEQALYWADIGNNRFFRWNPDSGDVQTFLLESSIGCLGLHDAGGLVLAVTEGIVHWQNGQQTMLVSREQIGAANRFNDGAVDRAGRFWIGTASNQAENHLYRLDIDGAITVMENDVIISNGLGWSPDNTTLYYSDSGGTGSVYAYDFDLETGITTNRRVFLPPTGTAAVADGLTVDREGCVWTAFWDGWRVERYDPDGRLMTRIEMPVQRPTSVMFGGAALDELYVTSASAGIDLNDQPQAGDVFRIRVDVEGLPEPACKLGELSGNVRDR